MDTVAYCIERAMDCRRRAHRWMRFKTIMADLGWNMDAFYFREAREWIKAARRAEERASSYEQ